MIMKINASTRLSSHYYGHAEIFVAQLKAQGYQSVGNGHNSWVLALPNSKEVVKIGSADEADSLSYKWLRWCKTSRNIFAPHILSLTLSRKGFFVATMERLTPASETDIIQFLDTSSLCDILKRSRVVPDRWDFIAPELIPEIRDRNLRSLFKTIYKLGTEYRGRHGLDITLENIMKRGSQLVFVDPVV